MTTRQSKHTLLRWIRGAIVKHVVILWIAAVLAYSIEVAREAWNAQFSSYSDIIQYLSGGLYAVFASIGIYTVVQAVVGLYGQQQHVKKGRVLAYIGFSGTCIVLAFATVYQMLSRDATSFGHSPLSVMSALYFSIVTFATVGYGDITPANDVARAIVSVEIIFAMLYNVLVLSLVGGFIRERSVAKSATDSFNPSFQEWL